MVAHPLSPSDTDTTFNGPPPFPIYNTFILAHHLFIFIIPNGYYILLAHPPSNICYLKISSPTRVIAFYPTSQWVFLEKTRVCKRLIYFFIYIISFLLIYCNIIMLKVFHLILNSFFIFHWFWFAKNWDFSGLYYS